MHQQLSDQADLNDELTEQGRHDVLVDNFLNAQCK